MNRVPFDTAFSSTDQAQAFAALALTELAPGTKGLLPQNCPVALGAVGQRGWNVLAGDVSYPAIALRLSAIERNSRTMQTYLAGRDISLAPHGKTSLAPQLFARQIADGAWGITISNVQHLAVCLHFGFRRLIIANQIVNPAELDYLMDALAEIRGLEIFVMVDSAEGVRRLAAAARGRAALPQCLVEIGFPGGRAGCRTLDEAVAVAREVRHHGLMLRGVSGFEGLLPDVGEVDRFLGRICDVAVACDAQGLFGGTAEIILSAGGSSFYDRLAARLRGAASLQGRTRIVARSGCYLTHDSGTYAHAFSAVQARELALVGEGFDPALVLFAQVLSRPEPTKAIVTLGRRDVGTDGGMPVPLLHYRPGRDARPAAAPDWTFAAINDQHGHLVLPADDDLMVGDLVGFGISHPCTTFDKWQVLLAVDDDWNVVDAIRTFF